MSGSWTTMEKTCEGCGGAGTITFSDVDTATCGMCRGTKKVKVRVAEFKGPAEWKPIEPLPEDRCRCSYEVGSGGPIVQCEHCKRKTEAATKPQNRYVRRINGRDGTTALVDIYDVLAAWGVTDQAIGHAIKKLFRSGDGHKDKLTDWREAVVSIQRAIENMPIPSNQPCEG